MESEKINLVAYCPYCDEKMYVATQGVAQAEPNPTEIPLWLFSVSRWRCFRYKKSFFVSEPKLIEENYDD